MLGIYCRISKVKADDVDTSILTQKEKGVEFAKSQNLDYEFFVDEGLSGNSDDIKSRPEFARLCLAIEKKVITSVFVLYQDRLERNGFIWQFFVSIVTLSGCKYYPNGVFTDLMNPQTRFITDVMSAGNALYSNLASVRTAASIKQRANEGKFRGITAYGYQHGSDKKLTINEQEANVVKRMFELSLEGNGAYTIAKILNAENIPTKFHRYKDKTHKRIDEYTNSTTVFKNSEVRWRGNVVYDIIKNSIYKGEKNLHGLTYQVPAIIDAEKWDLVNSNLSNNKKNVGKKQNYNYLLNGIIICKHCGRKFVGKKRSENNDNAYKCKGRIYPNSLCKESHGISIPKIDTFIIKHLFELKDLRNHLLSLPVNDDIVSILETKLKRENNALRKLEAESNRAYEVLLSPEFESDEHIKSKVIDLKKRIAIKKNLIADTESEYLINKTNNLKNRTENLLDSFKSNSRFEEIKQTVHSLIEWIEISHHKEEGKMGSFVIVIKYKGYNEVSNFITNWQAKKWIWISYKRDKAYNEFQLDEDREFMKDFLEYRNIKNDDEYIQKFKLDRNLTDDEISKMNPYDEKFAGINVKNESKYSTIELDISDLYDYNKTT